MTLSCGRGQSMTASSRQLNGWTFVVELASFLIHQSSNLQKNTVAFTGFEITPTSVRPCRQVIEAIKDFLKPRIITDVRGWFELTNQVAYAFASADRMKPFHKLLKPNSVFKWTDNLDTLFEKTKVIIVQEIQKGVEIFDKRRPTCLATDFRKKDVGFWLLQKHCNCTPTKPLCCHSG